MSFDENTLLRLRMNLFFLLSGAAEGNANEQDGSLAHLAKTEVCTM